MLAKWSYYVNRQNLDLHNMINRKNFELLSPSDRRS